MNTLGEMQGVGWTDENLVDHEDRLDTLEGDVSTEGSVLKDIKDNAQDATYDNTDSGLTAETLKTAVDELADEKEDESNKKVFSQCSCICCSRHSSLHRNAVFVFYAKCCNSPYFALS